LNRDGLDRTGEDFGSDSGRTGSQVQVLGHHFRKKGRRQENGLQLESISRENNFGEQGRIRTNPLNLPNKSKLGSPQSDEAARAKAKVHLKKNPET
jgi:hypothetical protein